jgi:MinD-like ATPase involved in chromosome partitioning or flagellar assembly
MPVNRLILNIDSPSGRHTVAVPEDARVADLLPSLVETCEGRTDASGWTLAPLGEAALDGDQRLEQIGLFAGAVLVLAQSAHAGTKGATQTTQLPPPPPRIAAMRSADYQGLLERTITMQESTASTVVAVISTNPGVGTTTVTALLATMLSALRGDQVAAVDASPLSGALSHWLVPDGALPAARYRALFEPSLTPTIVGDALVDAGPLLSVLPAPLDPSTANTGDTAGWSRLIEHLRHLHHFVLLDCGAGLQRAAGRAALARADQVVLVSKPEVSELQNLEATIEAIQRQAKSLVVVANQAQRHVRAASSAGGVPQITIAFEQEAAARLKRRGFDWARAPATWQEAVRELAAAVVAPD